MASIRKLPSGKWNVRIIRRGSPTITKTFINKADADKWGRITESELDRGVWADRSEAEATTLANALERYRREVTPKKKGASREANRIAIWLRSDLACRSIASLKPSDFAAYRDKRLEAKAAAATIRLELGVISHLFTIAIQEWGLSVVNPIQSIRKPTVNNARTRRLEGDEESRLLAACLESRTRHLYSMVVLSLETAMRRGEILSLTWSEIDLSRSVIKKDDSKNGEGRTIPLTEKALAVLPPRGIGRLFSHQPRSAFEAALKKAGITDFHWHDLRHEAVSRLFERDMNVMEVAAVSGHKTLQMLKRYTHLKPEDLLRKMNRQAPSV